MNEQEYTAKVRARTASYDRLLLDEAKKYAINPDNFETEEQLREAVNKLKENQ